MSVNFLHPSMIGRGAAQAKPSSGRAGPRRPGTDSIDWHAARRAGRACCCLARPAVIAVIPPAQGRPHPTDLLLCGHHYRVSRQRLAGAGATVVDLDGVPVADGAWPPTRAGG